MLVLGIHLQQIVHRRNATDKVAFLHLRDPSHHQLLPGSQLGSQFFGLGASRANLLRIAAVESNPGPCDRQVWILLNRGPPLLVATLQIQVLVVRHPLFVEFASLGRRSRDRHGRGIGFRHMVCMNRNNTTQTKNENGANRRSRGTIQATHRSLRNRADRYFWGGYRRKVSTRLTSAYSDERPRTSGRTGPPWLRWAGLASGTDCEGMFRQKHSVQNENGCTPIWLVPGIA